MTHINKSLLIFKQMAMNKIPCMYGKEMKVVTHDKFKTMTKKKSFLQLPLQILKIPRTLKPCLCSEIL